MYFLTREVTSAEHFVVVAAAVAAAAAAAVVAVAAKRLVVFATAVHGLVERLLFVLLSLYQRARCAVKTEERWAQDPSAKVVTGSQGPRNRYLTSRNLYLWGNYSSSGVRVGP